LGRGRRIRDLHAAPNRCPTPTPSLAGGVTGFHAGRALALYVGIGVFARQFGGQGQVGGLIY
ncbi:hypothetical protein FOZ63_024181, partial [Perkinsus olseni]